MKPFAPPAAVEERFPDHERFPGHERHPTMKIYLSGPLFTVAERHFNRMLTAALRAAGHEVWLPQEVQCKNNVKDLFRENNRGVQWADLIVTNMDGPDPDSGTAWECGRAYGRKPTLLLRTDTRIAEEVGHGFYNLMLEESATVKLLLEPTSVEDICQRIVEEVGLLSSNPLMWVTHVPGTIPGKEGTQEIAVLINDTVMSKWVRDYGRLDIGLGLIEPIMALITPGSTVADVGALLGDHTSSYATKAGMVHSFEPNPSAFACLTENCGDLPRVVLHNMALSDKAGTLRLKNHTNAGMNRIDPTGEVEIQTTTFDSFSLSPALIKIDVEGYELHVLRGAVETIKRCHPILVLEINQPSLALAQTTTKQIADFLEEHGYSAKDIRTGAVFTGDDPVVEHDILCL
jgi:FkbM family methyltransferase